MHTATHWDLIGRSMTALLLKSSPSSILPSPSPRRVLIPAMRYGTLFKRLLFNFSAFLKKNNVTGHGVGRGVSVQINPYPANVENMVIFF